MSDYARGAAYVGGQFVPIEQASISVLDWGFTRSDCVYDVVHVFRGGFFRLEDHLDRFIRSMQVRRLQPPEDRDAIADVLHRCVALSGLQDAYVAMVCSRGRPSRPGSRRPADCANHMLAYAVPWIDVITPDIQARGAHLWLASTPRVPDASVDPTVKNYQWSDLTSGLMEAHDNGYDTAVLFDADGMLTEGPGFNIFVVLDGAVVTPDRGSLHGITRASVFELCAELGIPARADAIPAAALARVEEAFAATTAGGLMPVARLGQHILGNDRPGPISAKLRKLYWDKHAQGWHRTPVRGLAPADTPMPEVARVQV